MRKKTGISIAIAFVLVIMLSAGAYSYLGGPTPSKNMGSYNSFSFYTDTSGNAAVQWMQPGNAPSNPADEFWFGPGGDFHTSAGITSPGPVAIGTSSTTANNLAQLTSDANFAGTVYFTGNATLTQSLTTTCDLRMVNGATISSPLVAGASGSVVTSGTIAQQTINGTVCNVFTPQNTPSNIVVITNLNDAGDLANGRGMLVVNTPNGTQNELVVTYPTGFINGGAVTNSAGTVIGYEVVLISPVTWYNGGAGYSYSMAKSLLNIEGSFEAGNYQCFTPQTPVQFGLNSVKAINPAWWGAKGNNTNDDTAAIQDAFNAAQGAGNIPSTTMGDAATVQFATGSLYKTTWSLYLPLTVSLDGMGSQIVYTPQSGITKQAALVLGSELDGPSDIYIWQAGTIRNLIIQGPLSGSALGTRGSPPANNYVGIFAGADYATTNGFAPSTSWGFNVKLVNTVIQGFTTGYEYGAIQPPTGLVVGAFENAITDCTFDNNYDAIASLPYSSTYSGFSEMNRVTSTNISNNVDCGFNIQVAGDEWEMAGGSLDYNGYSVCGGPVMSLTNVHEETNNTASPGGTSTAPSGAAFWNITGKGYVRKTGGSWQVMSGYYQGFAANTGASFISVKDITLVQGSGVETYLTWTNAATSENFCYGGLMQLEGTLPAVSDATSVTCTHN